MKSSPALEDHLVDDLLVVGELGLEELDVLAQRRLGFLGQMRSVLRAARLDHRRELLDLEPRVVGLRARREGTDVARRLAAQRPQLVPQLADLSGRALVAPDQLDDGLVREHVLDGGLGADPHPGDLDLAGLLVDLVADTDLGLGDRLVDLDRDAQPADHAALVDLGEHLAGLELPGRSLELGHQLALAHPLEPRVRVAELLGRLGGRLRTRLNGD
jgi:hypothetical protein